MKTEPRKDDLKIEKTISKSPLAPENIPFDAPFQPHEKTEEIQNNQSDKKSAEIIFENKDELPDFLRKKVDKN